MNDPKVLDFVIDQLAVDKVLWAIDYPYESSKPAVDFLDAAKISERDRASIYHLNAQRVSGTA